MNKAQKREKKKKKRVKNFPMSGRGLLTMADSVRERGLKRLIKALRGR